MLLALDAAASYSKEFASRPTCVHVAALKAAWHVEEQVWIDLLAGSSHCQRKQAHGMQYTPAFLPDKPGWFTSANKITIQDTKDHSHCLSNDWIN
jgi:hypothetical protein